MATLSASSVQTMYAGFWKRFIAYLLDSILVAIVTGILLRAIPALSFSGILIAWLYFAFMESSEHQATLGKMALGIKVTDLDGSRISFGTASIRYFSKILSALILMIGFIMAAFTAKKQALHDMIANTLVVKI
ncbi:MAG: hypothetical protein NVSMB52_00700 [Chloroflexota bacterium]